MQRSIALGGDPEVVERSRRLLAEWQGRHNPARGIDPVVREVWQTIESGSMRMNRGARKVFKARCRAAGSNLHSLWMATTTWRQVEELRQLRRRGGRPRRGRLSI